MARTDFKSVDEYIKAQPSELQPILRRVRSIIRKAVPEATETISYQIPAYKLADRALIYFATWKEHYSIYPATDPLMAAFKGELTPYRVSRGTGSTQPPICSSAVLARRPLSDSGAMATAFLQNSRARSSCPIFP